MVSKIIAGTMGYGIQKNKDAIAKKVLNSYKIVH